MTNKNSLMSTASEPQSVMSSPSYCQDLWIKIF